LQRGIKEPIQGVLRAKKAAACLLWVTDKPLARIEEILTQFGGRFDGAAGPIRGVSGRTYDLLPTVVRITELLHPGLDLTERCARLLTRLEIGLPAAAVSLAKHVGSRLTRTNYFSLLKAGLCNIGGVENSSDEEFLSCLDGNNDRLLELRKAVEYHHEQQYDPEIPLLSQCMKVSCRN
jgi:helicase